MEKAESVYRLSRLKHKLLCPYDRTIRKCINIHRVGGSTMP